MKLLEALEILRKPAQPEATRFGVLLACGFTPLHLKTYLTAELAIRLPARRVEVANGLFGDLAGTLERPTTAHLNAVAVAVEWPDLDPRLGIRTLGGWRHEDVPGIVDSALRQVERLASGLKSIAAEVPVAASMPTLPLPPLFSTPAHQASATELRLRQAVASFATELSSSPNLQLVRAQRLDDTSPPSERFDVRSEIAIGFPYRNSHASILAEALAILIQNPPPKKGLITDLDDTLWAGILGEVGVDGVAWDLSHSAHLHGIYQQFLSSLGSSGVLLAIASKNKPDLVKEVLLRTDILCGADVFFPLEVHWHAKSESVSRILKAWNIGPEAVVFVDDSPMEVAEVRAAYPELECLTFPRGDPHRLWLMLSRLRDLFGKATILAEDVIRLESIRSAPHRETSAPDASAMDAFLADAQARIEFTAGVHPDERAFELINKTNQFNLNGQRWDAAAWNQYLTQSEALLLTAGYTDKYGPLGKISALLVRRNGRVVEVAAWVMSCRAFSRRIEYQCLKYLFDRFDATEIAFDFVVTPRNGPICDFFSGILGITPGQRFRISRAAFGENCPALFHHIYELAPTPKSVTEMPQTG